MLRCTKTEWGGRKKNIQNLPAAFSAAQIQLSHLRPGANRAGSGVKGALLHFITAAFFQTLRRWRPRILCQDFLHIYMYIYILYIFLYGVVFERKLFLNHRFSSRQVAVPVAKNIRCMLETSAGHRWRPHPISQSISTFTSCVSYSIIHGRVVFTFFYLSEIVCDEQKQRPCFGFTFGTCMLRHFIHLSISIR